MLDHYSRPVMDENLQNRLARIAAFISVMGDKLEIETADESWSSHAIEEIGELSDLSGMERSAFKTLMEQHVEVFERRWNVR